MPTYRLIKFGSHLPEQRNQPLVLPADIYLRQTCRLSTPLLDLKRRALKRGCLAVQLGRKEKKGEFVNHTTVPKSRLWGADAKLQMANLLRILPRSYEEASQSVRHWPGQPGHSQEITATCPLTPANLSGLKPSSVALTEVLTSEAASHANRSSVIWNTPQRSSLRKRCLRFLLPPDSIHRILKGRLFLPNL